MEEKEETSNKFSLLGFIFTILILPLKFFAANPKVFLVFLAILASVGGTVYLARTRPEILGIQDQTVEQKRKETEELIKEVGKIIVLPEGETPTVATVTNVDEVKGQVFFSKALNGDKVLIYSVAKKAYLYRPSEKKIIEVGVVNLGEAQEKQNNNQNIPQEEISEDEVSTTPTITPSP